MSFLKRSAAALGTKVDTTKEHQAAQSGGGMPHNTLANCVIDKIEYKDRSTTEYNIKNHGVEASKNVISIQCRIKETADGKYVRKCLFKTLFLASNDNNRSIKDCQFLAFLTSLAENSGHSQEGLTEEIFEGDEWPSQETLNELLGLNFGIKSGLIKAKKPGEQDNEYIQTLSQPHDFHQPDQQADVPAGGVRRPRRQR